MGATFSVCFESDQCILPILCCLFGKADGIRNLEDNLVELRRDFNDLIAKRDGLLNIVKAEELKGRLRLPEVANWLSEVQIIETDTNQLFMYASALEAPALDGPIQDAPAQRASDAHLKKIISTYSLAETVFKKLIEFRNLSLRGYFEVVNQQAPAPMVEVRPYQQTFGLDTVLEKIWNSLMDDKNRILGICGMGGIGKTTLLARINNKFREVKDDFDVVIWVNVYEDADIGKIQDAIGKRLGLYDENWYIKTKSKRAGDIHRVLTYNRNRFVLLLDDLWKEVNLAAIGIPILGRDYKVVFTTRVMNVCHMMGANKYIKVQCLADKDAWDLFKQKARWGRSNDDEILGIAKEIAAKCCGVPLVLEIIGKTLASKNSVGEWRFALSILNSTQSDLRGIENGIFRVLKLSYDNLEKSAKLCFQYCALFPKEYYIKRDELVEYWIGEGIIGKKYGRQGAMDLGYDIIDDLVEAGLLLNDGESEQKVYMHDMIRAMVLWIVYTFENGENYVVRAGAGLTQLPYVRDWTTVTKMSLMNNEIKSIPDDPEYPSQSRLKTLFLQNNRLVEIVGNFFLVMSTLVVLDLSGNKGLTELPKEISMLVALRYLSLSGTRIKDLPVGLGELNKLIHLDLESTPSLQSITSILQLDTLQVFRFFGSGASLDVSILEHLQRLKCLERLTITVRKLDVLYAFLGSELAGKTQGIYLEGLEVPGISFAASFGALGSLCTLQMVKCDIIESDTEWEENTRHQSPVPTPSNQITPSTTWFMNLSTLVLRSCKHLRDLTWLIYAANLESLSITFSPMMEELISKNKAVGVVVEPFLKLQVLRLEYLDELKSIHWSSLYFPSLRKVNIKNCPKLHKLPLNSTSVRSIDDLCIQVDEWWLEGVEWESGGAKERFYPVIRTTSTV